MAGDEGGKENLADVKGGIQGREGGVGGELHEAGDPEKTIT